MMLFAALLPPVFFGGTLAYAMKPTVDFLKWQFDAGYVADKTLPVKEQLNIRIERVNLINSAEFKIRNFGLFQTCKIIIPQDSDFVFKNGTNQTTAMGAFMKWQIME